MFDYHYTMGLLIVCEIVYQYNTFYINYTFLFDYQYTMGLLIVCEIYNTFYINYTLFSYLNLIINTQWDYQ